MSETASAKPYLQRFCQGDGLDLGCGDDKIKECAIGIDIRVRGRFSDILHDASNLRIFSDNYFDYAFSSHLLEDFEDTKAVLKEWVRVLKIGGHLVLFLPDQQVYLAHCRKYGVEPNKAHKHPDFSMAFVLDKLDSLPVEIIYTEVALYNPYSFAIVARKIESSPLAHLLNDHSLAGQCESPQTQPPFSHPSPESQTSNPHPSPTHPVSPVEETQLRVFRGKGKPHQHIPEPPKLDFDPLLIQKAFPYP